MPPSNKPPSPATFELAPISRIKVKYALIRAHFTVSEKKTALYSQTPLPYKIWKKNAMANTHDSHLPTYRGYLQALS